LITVLGITQAAPCAEIRGRIGKVDLDKKELVFEPLGRRVMPLTLALDKDTQVLFGKQVATPDDLPVGRRAQVEYEERDGRLVAQVIHVNGARPARPAAPAAPMGEGLAGVLQRVALTDREIVVIGPGAKGPETETTILVPEAAKIARGDKAVAFDALKEGESVLVQTEKRDGRLAAVSIQVGPGGAAPMNEKCDPIPRIRRILKIVDQVLEEIERK
jgi:hypothetical protein